jgi:hypothetical protein
MRQPSIVRPPIIVDVVSDAGFALYQPAVMRSWAPAVHNDHAVLGRNRRPAVRAVWGLETRAQRDYANAGDVFLGLQGRSRLFLVTRPAVNDGL